MLQEIAEAEVKVNYPEGSKDVKMTHDPDRDYEQIQKDTLCVLVLKNGETHTGKVVNIDEFEETISIKPLSGNLVCLQYQFSWCELILFPSNES